MNGAPPADGDAGSERFPVVIAAQDPLVRSELSSRLAASGRVVLTDAVRSLALALPAALRASAIVLWDVGVVGGGEEAPLAGKSPSPPVVALVASQEMGQRLLRRGLAGAIYRDAEGSRIAAALLAAAAGLTVMDVSFFGEREPHPVRESSVEKPTPRELEVLQQVALGGSNKAIGEVLGISEHTVKFHLNQLMQKLGVERRTEAVVRAARLGWLIL